MSASSRQVHSSCAKVDNYSTTTKYDGINNHRATYSTVGDSGPFH